MVVSCHAGIFGASWYRVADPPHLAVSGFFGVEAFFVLSGFLIGRILLGTVAADPRPRTLATFLVRRWARTLPLYAVCLALLPLVWPPAGGLASVLPFFATMTQNLAWPTRAFWFPVSWSLAVEEWFYVLFPLLVLLIARRRRRGGAAGAMRTATLVFLLVPLAARAALPAGIDWNDVTRQIVLLRLDAIAFGVAACLVDAGRFGEAVRRRRRVLALLGAAILALQWWGGLQGSGRFAIRLHDVFATDIADGGFALTLFALDAMARPASVIATPVRLVAERSYGLYLTHLTLLQVADRGIATEGWSRPVAIVVLLALFVALPSLSWRFFERPILRLARRPLAAAPGGSVVRPGLRPG